jgi:hypothetical protein
MDDYLLRTQGDVNLQKMHIEEVKLALEERGLDALKQERKLRGELVGWLENRKFDC